MDHELVITRIDQNGGSMFRSEEMALCQLFLQVCWQFLKWQRTSGDPNTEHVKHSNCPNPPSWEMVRVLNTPAYRIHKQACFSPVFRPPIEYRTIWHLDTNLPFEYQTSPIFRWLLYWTVLFIIHMIFIASWLCYRTRLNRFIYTQLFWLLKNGLG